MAIYEGVRDFGLTAYGESSDATIGIRWIKVHAQALGAARVPRKKDDNDGLGPPNRHLLPYKDLGGHSGMLMTGEAPLWLLAEDTASSRIVECAFKPIYGFTQIAAEHGPMAGLFSLGEEVYAGNISEESIFSSTLPFTRVIQHRRYTDVAFHALSQSYAAIATYDAPFEIFSEEGEPLHSESDTLRQEPTGTRSSLELIEPGSWQTVDG